MLSGAGGQDNVIAFSRTDAGKYGRITAQWDMKMGSGADGYNFTLLNTANYGNSGARGTISGAEEEPVVNNSFSVAFDIYCKDYDGNLGEHEISLHLDGVERANKWSGFDYRNNSFDHVIVDIDFVAGGAEITLSVGGTKVYDKYFLAGLFPYESRVSFGARTGGVSTNLSLDNINVVYDEPVTSVEEPIVVRAFDQQLMNGPARDVEGYFDFPAAPEPYERVVMKFTVEEPPAGWDPWDRLMNISVWDGETRYEIARFMTPYSRAGVWYFDVTDYQYILKGNKKLSMFCDTWWYTENAGYLFTTDFEFYKGNPIRKVVGIQNLWVGTPMYGDQNDQTMSNFFTDKNILIPGNADQTKLRFMVTGHGQAPNADNAAEFLVRGRTVTVNNNSFYNVLWKNDCYLNVCRPQSGTWVYSRAGWAPGDAVTPWELDVSDLVTPGSYSAIDYTADPYYNSSPNWENVSRHWVESQIVFYEDYSPDAAASWAMEEGEGAYVYDGSGNEKTGTLRNMSQDNWVLARGCGGLGFDGVNDYVEISGYKGVTGGLSRSCCAWIKTEYANGQIMSWGTLGTGTKWVVRTNGDGSLRAEVQGGAIYGSTYVADGRWHYVAVVLADDGSTDISEAKLYVDGYEDVIGAASASPVNTGMDNVKIGVFTGLSNYYSGQIDNVEIYGRALSSDEIYQKYVSSALTVDVVKDNVIDMQDFAMLAESWLDVSSGYDVTCDGVVGLDDIAVFADQWLDSLE